MIFLIIILMALLPACQWGPKIQKVITDVETVESDAQKASNDVKTLAQDVKEL